jgi:hypothetical protein
MHRGHAATPAQIRAILKDVGLAPERQWGKWFLNRRLINCLPLPLARLVACLDRAFARIVPSLAWDVFVLARKVG